MAADKSDKWYRQLRPGDLFVYAAVLAVSLLMLFSAPARLLGDSGSADGQPLRATVWIDNELVYTIEQAELIAGGSYSFEAYDYHYIIKYADGRVRIEEADCPDQVCVLTGWLARNGQITACVPGHVLLKIEGSLDSGDETSQTTDELDVILR
jgi:hypothetical protein